MRRRRSSQPALFTTLSAILPTAAQTQLLRACLWEGASSHTAWQCWQQEMGGERDAERLATRDMKLLSPLVSEAQRQNKFAVSDFLSTRLRTARLREEGRYQAYCAVLQQVCETLDRAEIPALLVQGAALAQVWPAPELRHTTDVDLLMPPALLEPGEKVLLSSADCIRRIHPQRWLPSRVTLLHRSGLPIVLRRQLFTIQYYRCGWKQAWQLSLIHI